MKDKKNRKAQSEDNVKSYLSGKLTGKAKNAFEREILKDAFLEEAMEGFSEISPEQYGTDLKKLEKRLKRRTEKSGKVFYYRIAASIAILIAVSVFLLIERDRSEKVFREEVQLEIALNQPILKMEDAGQDRTLDTQVNVRSEQAKENRETIDDRKKTITDDIIVTESRFEELRSADEASDETISLAFESRKDTENISRIPERAMSPAAAGSKSIRSYDTRPEAKEDTEKILTEQEDVPNQVKITLFYNGVMLSDFAGQTMTDENIPPMPIPGIEAFISYFRINLSPETIADTKYPVIEAAFRVLTDGSVDSIMIKTPSGGDLADEVTRIIMKGPEWKSAKRYGIPVKGDVTLRIELIELK